MTDHVKNNASIDKEIMIMNCLNHLILMTALCTPPLYLAPGRI